jgi:hypothetical protein
MNTLQQTKDNITEGDRIFHYDHDGFKDSFRFVIENECECRSLIEIRSGRGFRCVSCLKYFKIDGRKEP